MTTSLVCHSHAIAPSRVIRGEHAWQQGLPAIADLCHRPALLGRSPATQGIRAELKADLISNDLTVEEIQLNFDCCEEDLIRLELSFKATGCDSVIAAGGGKVLDAGKLLAYRLNVPCITVPLSAATCAGWTALANIYSQDGAFVSDVALDACPDLLIFDHGLVRQAPNQTLASGIADALAKWYEASVGSGSSSDGMIQQAVQMARVLRDQLLIDALDAMARPESEAWVRVAEACGLTAGVIGGLGGAQCRTVAAHAVHNGLTQLPSCHGNCTGRKWDLAFWCSSDLKNALVEINWPPNPVANFCPYSGNWAYPFHSKILGLEKQVCMIYAPFAASPAVQDPTSTTSPSRSQKPICWKLSSARKRTVVRSTCLWRPKLDQQAHS